MLHPLYFRPNNVTHRLINKPEPVGAPAAYSTMSTNTTDLNNLIILDGVKTKGHGLAFTNKAGKRAPEITTEKVKKVNEYKIQSQKEPINKIFIVLPALIIIGIILYYLKLLRKQLVQYLLLNQRCHRI